MTSVVHMWYLLGSASQPCPITGPGRTTQPLVTSRPISTHHCHGWVTCSLPQHKCLSHSKWSGLDQLQLLDLYDIFLVQQTHFSPPTHGLLEFCIALPQESCIALPLSEQSRKLNIRSAAEGVTAWGLSSHYSCWSPIRPGLIISASPRDCHWQ